MPNIVEIVVKTLDESAQGMASAEKKARESGTKAGNNFTQGMSPSIKSMGKMILGAFAVTEGIVIFKDIIDRGEQARRSIGLVTAAIRSTGGVAHVTASEVEDLARAISLKSGKDEIAITSGEAMLLTFRNIHNAAGANNDIFNQATQVLTDMTSAMHGGDVSSQGMRKQAIQLGKALNDPIHGMTALRRVGVQFTDQQTAQVKALAASGNLLGAQKIILGELTKEFGGAAARSSTSIDKLKNEFNILKDTLAKGLDPTITDSIGKIGSMTTGISGLVTKLNSIKEPMAGTAKQQGILNQAWGVATKGMFDHIIPGFTQVKSLMDKYVLSTHKAADGTKSTSDKMTGLASKVDIARSRYADLIHPSGTANKSIFDTGNKAHDAAPKVLSLKDAVLKLNGAESQLGATITWSNLLITAKDDAHALSLALKKSHDSIGLHTQAQRDSFRATNTYIDDLLQMAQGAGKNRTKQDEVRTAIEKALPKLESVKNKSAAYKDELKKLAVVLDNLAKKPPIHESIFMSGKGTWGIFGKNPVNSGLFNAPGAATGMYVGQGTTSTADDVMIRASKGELVVPTDMVRGGEVDHLRGRIPGFASGGVIPHYSGRPGGLAHWTAHNWKASLSSISNSMSVAIQKQVAAYMLSMMGGGRDIVSYAKGFLGKIPYVWGGQSAAGADCSGFVNMVYRHFGIHPPRTSEAQGAWVKKGPPVPGGLAFYNSPAGGPPPGHVAIVATPGSVISQGGGMGPVMMGIRGMPLMFTGSPPGGFPRSSGGGRPSSGHWSVAGMGRLWQQHGGPGWLSRIMGAIGMAESGGDPRAWNPSGATGLWQILGAVDPRDQGSLTNAGVNAKEAVLKWRTHGLGAWQAFTNGTYRQFMDNGGWLRPGWNPPMYNGTGRPEHLVPAGGRRVTPGRSGSGPLIHIGTVVVREAADVDLLARRLAFMVEG